VYLLVLGYMIAYWGGNEIKLKRRLKLLKEINLLANPRFGVSETIGALLERLRALYQADDCWLIISDVVALGPALRAIQDRRQLCLNTSPSSFRVQRRRPAQRLVATSLSS
jgi:hypothetical protein